ncbi:hypothetical protein ACFXKW_21005 [Streptomyces sp. NPDC059193]|uniref:hypothetical protein n=1 Tax=Streptomyces sp. NPDC059193 TaxID=3346763 RepID=UPI0036BCD9F5
MTAYYTYDWRTPETLDPLVRVAPYAAPAALEKMRPLSASFPVRMKASREASRLTVRSAGTEGDAPADSPDSAFIVVAYTQHTTNETDTGAVSTEGKGAWSLHLTRTGQGWQVAAIVAQS